jgi:chromosome segregation ATPase
MTTKMNCARSIRNLATLYREMDEAATVLETLGSFEQAQKEAQVRLDTLRGQAVEAENALKALKATLAKNEEAASVALSKRIAEAQANVQKMVSDAEGQATEIIKKGQDESSKLVAEAVSEKNSLSGEVASLQGAIEAAKAELAALNADKESALSSLQRLRSQLNDMKAKLAGL